MLKKIICLCLIILLLINSMGIVTASRYNDTVWGPRFTLIKVVETNTHIVQSFISVNYQKESALFDSDLDIDLFIRNVKDTDTGLNEQPYVYKNLFDNLNRSGIVRFLYEDHNSRNYHKGDYSYMENNNIFLYDVPNVSFYIRNFPFDEYTHTHKYNN